MLIRFPEDIRIFIACGYTDMRRQIDGLAAIVQMNFQLDPFQNSLFLFCGKKRDRMKALFWEGDGFLLLYKRLESGMLQWPKSTEDVREITPQQYLSAILDLSDKSIVSFVMSHSNNNRLVLETFDIARQSHPEVKPIFHSDRGFQYTSKIFRKKLDDARMKQSMSRVARCIDNGPMEAFWGMLKSEMYYLKKFSTYEELKHAIETYIDYYNHHRYQKRLNSMTPLEFRDYLGSVA